MDVLFVALNPPKISNDNGHYFSRVKTFWDILFESNLIEKNSFPLNEMDVNIFGNNLYNYSQSTFGITDLVKNTVETNSSKVKAEEDNLNDILSLLDNEKVDVLVLMHSKVINCFKKHSIIPKHAGYGFAANYRKTKIFNVPFPTGSSIPKNKIVQEYKKVYNELVRVKSELK